MPANPNLVGLTFPFIRPFAIGYSAQFRAPGPPDLSSKACADDLNEVAKLGVAGGANLTAEQQEIAPFNVEAPSALWPRSMRAYLDDARVVAANTPLPDQFARPWLDRHASNRPRSCLCRCRLRSSSNVVSGEIQAKKRRTVVTHGLWSLTRPFLVRPNSDIGDRPARLACYRCQL